MRLPHTAPAGDFAAGTECLKKLLKGLGSFVMGLEIEAVDCLTRQKFW